MKALLLPIALLATPAFADKTVVCPLSYDGAERGQNSRDTISFEANDFFEFSLQRAKHIGISVDGSNDMFSRRAINVTVVDSKSETVMIYTSDSNSDLESIVRIDRSPGEAVREGFFRGQVNFYNSNNENPTSNTEPELPVYRFTCKLR